MKKFFFILFFSMILFVSAARGAEGEVSSSGIMFPYVAQVTGENVNLRAGQSTNFEVIGELKLGEEIVIIGESYDWFEIRLPAHADAYVSAKFVEELGQGTGRITANRLNIRGGPATRFSIIGQLKEGDVVRIREKKLVGEEEWFRIEPPVVTSGWVSARFVGFKGGAVPAVAEVKAPSTEITRGSAPSSTPAVETVTTDPGGKTFKGRVEALAVNDTPEHVRHRITAGDQVTYWLKGYRSVLDQFLHSDVEIEGSVLEDVDAPHPVILVRKVTYIL